MTCCSIDALPFAQNAQRLAMDALHDARAEHGYDHPDYHRTVAVYDATVATLIGILGPSAPCASVDPLTFETFCDVYKDRTGFKPRGFTWSLAEVDAWLLGERDRPVEDETYPSDDEILAEAEAAHLARQAETTPEAWQIAAARVPGVREEWLSGY